MKEDAMTRNLMLRRLPRLGDLLARAHARHEAARSAERLRHLDDHLLRDIGITRDDIDALVRGR
jgi:uncharacterized protein YjiS (DUF1127 family)